MITRTNVARYLADAKPAERSSVIQQAAAWLVTTKRTRQLEYLSQDVARLKAESGRLLLRVTTARQIAKPARDQIVAFAKAQTGAKQVELAERLDPTVLGGVRLETPTAVLDDTVARRLADMVTEVAK